MGKSKNPAAVSLGRLGGLAGRGESKARTEQMRAYWRSPAGMARRRKTDETQEAHSEEGTAQEPASGAVSVAASAG